MSSGVQAARFKQVFVEPASLGHEIESAIIIVPYNKSWWKAQEYRGLNFKVIVRTCRKCMVEGGKSHPKLQQLCPRR